MAIPSVDLESVPAIGLPAENHTDALPSRLEDRPLLCRRWKLWVSLERPSDPETRTDVKLEVSG